MDKEAIYREYQPKVFGYLRGHLNSLEDAEDICSEVFVKVYEKWDTFDESKASISTWIFTVMKNTLFDHFRTRKVDASLDDEENPIDETEINSENNVEDFIRFHDMVEGVKKLPKQQQDVIVLHYYYGLTLVEIAEKMGFSYRYIKTLHAKALTCLRQCIE